MGSSFKWEANIIMATALGWEIDCERFPGKKNITQLTLGDDIVMLGGGSQFLSGLYTCQV